MPSNRARKTSSDQQYSYRQAKCSMLHMEMITTQTYLEFGTLEMPPPSMNLGHELEQKDGKCLVQTTGWYVAG